MNDSRWVSCGPANGATVLLVIRVNDLPPSFDPYRKKLTGSAVGLVLADVSATVDRIVAPICGVTTMTPALAALWNVVKPLLSMAAATFVPLLFVVITSPGWVTSNRSASNPAVGVGVGVAAWV